MSLLWPRTVVTKSSPCESPRTYPSDLYVIYIIRALLHLSAYERETHFRNNVVIVLLYTHAHAHTQYENWNEICLSPVEVLLSQCHAIVLIFFFSPARTTRKTKKFDTFFISSKNITCTPPPPYANRTRKMV